MLGSGAILGAPSLPTFTTRRPSAEAEDPASPSPSRRIPAPAEFRRSPRTAEPPRISPSRTESVVRSPRQGPVGVAGRASIPPSVPVRTVAVSRIVDAAAHLRPEKVTRLRLALHPEPLGELVVELSLRGGAVHGVVQVATEAAKELVSADLAHLRSDLERRGIRVAALEVVLSGSESVIEKERPSALGRRLVDFWA